MRIIAIVPFLNEARFLPGFLESIARQTRRPDRLVLVDDGSADLSGAIADAFASRHSFVDVLHRPPRPPQRDRLATAAELQAFLWALARVESRWDVIAKLDADLQLTSVTIATIAERFERDPTLGMAGSYLTEIDGEGRAARLSIRPEHVHGATKFYRRACFEDISPLSPIIGWDTIDEVRARLRGWRTQSFAMPGGDPLHRRKRGSQDGMARGHRRAGEASYSVGAHPLHVLLYGLRLMTETPGTAGGLNYLAGWSAAAVRRPPRAEREVRMHVQQDELARIRRRIARYVRRADLSIAAP